MGRTDSDLDSNLFSLGNMNEKKKKTMMMKTKKKKKFDVFEFDDDKSIEPYPKRFPPLKLQSHANKTKFDSRDQSPITKYHFLQSFARGIETVDQGFRTESIDVDAKGTKTPEAGSNRLLDIHPNDVGGLQHSYCAISPNSTQHGDSPVKVENSGVDAHLISSSSFQKTKKYSRVSYETLSTEMSSLSTSTFCSEENQMSFEEQQIEPDYGGYKLDDKHKTVKIFPDHIVYREILTESCVTFSCHSIKIEGSTFTGICKPVSFQWAIGDIISIESGWSELVKTAIVTLHLKVTGNANKTSGFEPLYFSVYDLHWAKRLEAIKSLDVRYKDKWNINFDADVASDRKHLFGESSMFSRRSCIPGSDEHFEEVIYPEGDPDAVIISKRDVELLQPETFINDNIIDFYVKYLANKIQSEKRHRFHFFNSFFFRKLADLDKDPSSAYEGRAAFQRVRKWTRKVNLFVKDYIIIPVNYSLHWSLLVICHPGEVPNFKGEESESTSKVPCILHMDSIKGSHRGLKNLIQSYLCEEWKERHSDTTEDVLSKFLNLRFVPLELPQQENLFDCGLFLLHYVELFLEEAPLDFSLFKISKFSKFLTENWFLPVEASLKRSVIKKIIYGIHDNSHKIRLADLITECPVVPNETGNQETGIISLEKMGNEIKTCHDTASTSNAEINGISLSETSLLRDDQYCRESGAIARPFTDANLQLSAPYGRSILSPIEETEEAPGQVSRSPLEKEECHQVAKSPSDIFSRFHSGDLETPENNELSLSCRKVNDGFPISGTSSGFPNFPEIAIHVVIPLQDLEGSDHLAEPNKEESSSTSCEELTARAADDTEEGSNEISSTPICIENKACVVPDSEEDSNEISYVPCIDVERDFGKRDRPTENIIRNRNIIRTSTNRNSSSGDAVVSESDELRTTKKQRIKAAMGGKRRVTRSLSNIFHI